LHGIGTRSEAGTRPELVSQSAVGRDCRNGAQGTSGGQRRQGQWR
jgi:hypothetical protein